ncbi:MAG TPA: holo-ACP synthase [Gemmatimonadaceae bacterium]|nr:holo-ACP synthase [Gemmatimonadaceae bacterium]
MIAGMGMDVVDIARARRLLEHHGERALVRLFTPAEAAYARERTEPYQHLAARLAAKEAAFKALSGSEDARAIGWREIEVISSLHRAPTLRLHGRAAARAAELCVRRIWVTLTHSHTTAAAVVVLER